VCPQQGKGKKGRGGRDLSGRSPVLSAGEGGRKERGIKPGARSSIEPCEGGKEGKKTPLATQIFKKGTKKRERKTTPFFKLGKEKNAGPADPSYRKKKGGGGGEYYCAEVSCWRKTGELRTPRDLKRDEMGRRRFALGMPALEKARGETGGDGGSGKRKMTRGKD